VTVGVDDGSGGQIAAGDYFEIQVTEDLHPDESTPTWPETAIKTAETYTVSLNANAGETASQVRDRLLGLINAQAASDHLPTAVADGTIGIKFTAGKEGENYDVVTSYNSTADSLTPATITDNGLGNSITKSLRVLNDMLAQNSAESARLNSAQESLENHIVNGEQAWGRITDTDYARASTDLVKNQLSMQMANQIISKSMRLNDLLIPLTTEHYRGSVLSSTL
jgi:flagellin-like hook-associated protein FlgL